MTLYKSILSDERTRVIIGGDKVSKTDPFRGILHVKEPHYFTSQTCDIYLIKTNEFDASRYSEKRNIILTWMRISSVLFVDGHVELNLVSSRGTGSSFELVSLSTYKEVGEHDFSSIYKEISNPNLEYVAILTLYTKDASTTKEPSISREESSQATDKVHTPLKGLWKRLFG